MELKSKHWLEHEIKGIMNIDGRRVIYLKTPVKRLWRYNDHLMEYRMDHNNKSIAAAKSISLFYKLVLGQDDAPDN